MEKNYLNAMHEILANGTVREDRTGVGTIGLFGMQQRYNLSKGFPAVTTKKLAWKSVVSELLWFIEGSGDERRLSEILHGTRNTVKSTIWTANAEAEYWRKRYRSFPPAGPQYEGDLGRVYGVQWRRWQSPDVVLEGPNKLVQKEVDQLLNLVEGIKNDPYGRRHIISAWNPGELDKMALPPCHTFAQFYVADNKLSCQMYQRSADFFLGVPFNIASYSLFTHMIAQVCNLEVGEFIHTIGDGHIYTNHVEQVKEQLSREPYASPVLKINPDVKDITKFTMEDFELVGYDHHPAIKADMAV
jgi:thymidylate synthase